MRPSQAASAALFLAAALSLCTAPAARAASPVCGAAAFGNHPVAAKPHLIVLSAPSGGGKTTLTQMLLKEFPKLTQSVSSTTRAPRGQEQDGVDYHFLTKEEFKARVAAGKFAEWAEVHGNFYGTEISNIRDQFSAGRSVIALVDIKGADILRKSFAEEIYTIFITPPDMATLEARLRGRGTDPEAAIQLRLANAQAEMNEAPRYDKVIVNDKLEDAFKALAHLARSLGLIPE